MLCMDVGRRAKYEQVKERMNEWIDGWMDAS